jgi:hypothetical protein
MEKIQKTSTLQNITHPEVTTGDSSDVAFDADPATHGFTTLVAAAPVIEPSDSTTTQFYSPPLHKDILSYFARPSKVFSGVFSNGSISPIFTLNLLPPYYRSYLTNLTGAYGFRATFCLRLEIVASPQTSGIVKAAFFPLTSTLYTSKVSARPVMAQVQNVEVNVSEASALEIKVPFIHPEDFMLVQPNVEKDGYTVGQIMIMPYLPVQWDSTTSTSPSYTVYQWFEDVEPIGKTSNTIAVTPQMNTEFKGPVSKWFGYASDIASKLSVVPYISTYAKPVSWISRTAAMVAAHFGWSKPVNGSYMGIIGSTLARGINTCADQDMAQPLAMYANNEVSAFNFANNELDEMSICYLTCKPSLIATIDWTPFDNDVKWTCPVTPAAFVFQSGLGFPQAIANVLGVPASGNKLGFYPSPVAFVASHFRFWRGDLVFRFKFARTKFHSGRILVGYMPQVDQYSTTTPGTVLVAPPIISRYDYESIVVDLRSTSEVDLVVPYTYPNMWCDTNSGPSFITGAKFYNTGVVFVRVIDQLYGPDNVPQNVPIAVEVFAKCGLEFAMPTTSQYGVLAPNAPVITQMDTKDLNDNEDACVKCIGERILSVKQLAMRPLWRYRTPPSKSQILEASLQYAPTVAFDGATPYAHPVATGTIISNLSVMYGFIRGSMIARFVPALTTLSNRTAFASSVILTDTANPDWSHNPYSVENGMVNMVKIPFYHQHNRILTGYSKINIDTTRRVLFENIGGTDSPCLFGTAAGDDFQFGAFNGVPAMVQYDPIPASYDPYFYKPSAPPA